MAIMKRVSFLFLAAAIIICGVFALIGDSPAGIFPVLKPASANRIYSDGRSFSIPMIEAIKLEQDSKEIDLLPSIGSRETLLKLLLDRGALYDPAEYEMWNYRTRSDGFSVASDMAVTETALGGETMPSAPVPSAAPNEANAMTEPGNPAGHSETNEQVEGVSEGDIVKTDGKYIYAMSQQGDTLRIIRADGPQLEVVSVIYNDNFWGTEFYITGNDRLVIIGNEYIDIQPSPVPEPSVNTPGFRSADIYYGVYSRSFTVAAIYDITDRSAPAEARRISMDGWNVSTRVIDSTLYLVTNRHIWHVPYDRADSQSILPYCRDTNLGDEFEPLDYENIFFIPDTEDTSYLLIGAIDIYGNEPFEPTAYFGAGSNFFMSRSAMYITQFRWEQPATSATGVIDGSSDVMRWEPPSYKTDIMRFAVNGTDVSYTGTGTAEGSPINQYSMDEYNGYFRIATTDWSIGTYVTVMDTSTMQTVGRTEPLAPEEQMYSARFMGDMGYVVTFQMVDPLFTIDLSDPYNPKVLGELKIPGFSQYLHPVGDGLLMGIGRDTQEVYTRDANGVERVINFIDVGLKISLFDVSDPFDPREVDVLPLGEGWTEVSHNPRALMTDSRQGFYGFVMETWGNNSWGGRSHYTNNAVILRVDDGRLTVAAWLDIGSDYYYGYGTRLCFIDSTLYVVHEAGVDAYDYTTFAKLGGIKF